MRHLYSDLFLALLILIANGALLFDVPSHAQVMNRGEREERRGGEGDAVGVGGGETGEASLPSISPFFTPSLFCPKGERGAGRGGKRKRERERQRQRESGGRGGAERDRHFNRDRERRRQRHRERQRQTQRQRVTETERELEPDLEPENCIFQGL